MKHEKLIRTIIAIALLAAGSIVVGYYWTVETFSDIKILPFFIKVVCFVYIILQILKRYLVKTTNWWDWLYYIGLLCVVIPSLMITEENNSMFTMMAQYGTFFLIIPALLDGRNIMQKK